MLTATDVQKAYETFGVIIQRDRSGVGHCWEDVDSEDLRIDIFADACHPEDGSLNVGEFDSGGQKYRVVKCRWE